MVMKKPVKDIVKDIEAKASKEEQKAAKTKRSKKPSVFKEVEGRKDPMWRNEWPKHRMGVRTGYDLYENGDIKVAPMYRDELNAIVANQAGINETLRVVQEQCAKQLNLVHVAKQRFWQFIK